MGTRHWARTEVGRPSPACPTGKSGLMEVMGGTGAEDVLLGIVHRVSFTSRDSMLRPSDGTGGADMQAVIPATEPGLGELGEHPGPRGPGIWQ